MSSSLKPGPGRPPGQNTETIELARRVQMHDRDGLRTAEIAELEQVSPDYVKLLKRMSVDQPAAGVRQAKPPPKRLSERALVHHAVLAMRRDTRLRAFAPAKKLFWLDCVMEIYALGDEDGLAFGADGDPFETHGDFAAAVGGEPDDLEHFLRRGLLTRLPDGGIDLPSRIGLKPKEKPRVMLQGSGEHPLSSAFAGLANQQNEMDDGQSFRINKTTQTGREITEFSYPPGSEIPPISLPDAALACAADADAKSKIDQSSSISISNGSRADARPDQTNEFSYPPGSEIPGSDISSQQSGPNDDREIGLIAFTGELAGLAMLDRAPNADELGAVQGWLAAGHPAEMIRAVVENGLARRGGNPPSSLLYFRKPLAQARAALESAPIVVAPAPPQEMAKPMEAPHIEEPIIGDDPDAQNARVQRAIEKEIGPTDCQVWLSKATFCGIDDDNCVTLSFSTQFMRDSIRSRFGDRLRALWRAENPAIDGIEYVVAPPEKRRADG